MKTNGKKLALRRQSIRTLSDSELRIAYGGVPSASVSATPSTRPAVTGTSVVDLGKNPSGGIVLHLPNGRVLNPSGGRQNPSGGSIDIP
jgi:hypothetical protein